MEKIEQLKKVLTKASKLEKGKELMVAEELIQIDDKINTTKKELQDNLDENIGEIDTKLDKIGEVLTPINQNITVRGEKITLIKGKDGKDGTDGKNGVDGKRGEKGDKGEKGKDGKDGRNGIDGIDGLNGKDGINGIDGLNGTNGKDGSPDTPEQVIDKLNKSDKLIKKDRVEGLQDIENNLKHNLYTGISETRALELIRDNTSSRGSAWGDITGTLSNQTDLQTALDLKAPLASPTFTGTVTLPVGTGYVHISTSSGATTTGANTNPVDVTGAVFTYVNNAIYRIWVMGRINSTAATTGVGIQFDVSTAITDINVHTIHPLATSTTATAYSIADDVSAGVSTGVPAGPLDVPFRTEALFRPGDNTGTCQLRFRAEVAAVTELLAGVTMIVERIA